jgi:hypothetical protein
MVTGHKHRRLEQQVTQLVELGELRIEFGVGRAPTLTRFAVRAGQTRAAFEHLRAGLGDDAIAEVVFHDPPVDTDGPVVVAMPIAASFPSHDFLRSGAGALV